MKIIVTGGVYPDNWQSIQENNNDNFIRFSEGEIILLDWDTAKVEKRISYVSPEKYRNPSMMFKGGEVYGDNLNVVTNSEVITYNVNTWQLTKTISIKSFNDLHGIMQEETDYWVVNTGLEIIQKISSDGRIKKKYNVATKSTWERFDSDEDYRKIGSTKPHEIHVNHVFKVKNDYYATRMLKKDAISLNDPDKRFDIRVGNPHDGIVFDGKVYFTTTNGHLLIFDGNDRSIIKCINLDKVLKRSGIKQGGWCRGVLPVSNNKVIVGFTQLRNTKFKEFVSWTKSFGHNPAPTRLLEIDINTEKVIKEVNYPNKNGTAIFSIIKYPEKI